MTAATDALKTELAEQQPADQPAPVPATTGPRTALDTLKDDAFKAEVARALPAHVDPSSFVRHAATLVAQNPDLLTIARGGPATDPQSIIRGVMRAAALGLDLDPTLGQAWLVPRKVKGVHQAIFQPGYQGYLELVMRTGKVRRIEVERIYSNDRFEARKGATGDLVFEPDWFGDRGTLKGWYALAELDGGVTQWVVMSLSEIQAHRDRYAFKTGSGTFVGPWGDHFEAMGDKTAFLQLVRWLPKSTELAGAISDDPESTGLIDTVATTVADDVIDVDEAS